MILNFNRAPAYKRVRKNSMSCIFDCAMKLPNKINTVVAASWVDQRRIVSYADKKNKNKNKNLKINK